MHIFWFQILGILLGTPEAWAENEKLKRQKFYELAENPCQALQRRRAEYSYQAMAKEENRRFLLGK